MTAAAMLLATLASVSGCQARHTGSDDSGSEPHDSALVPDSALPDSGGPADGGKEDGGADAPEELCDGLDDDDDGVIDDGFPDSDGDGRADCMQCAVESTEGALEVGETSCTVDWTPSDDPWDVELAWEWRLPEGHGEDFGCSLTAAGDIDGDGVIELLCQGSTLYVIDGSSGTLQREVEGYLWSSAHALYDADRDGVLDIVGITEDGETLVVDGNGVELIRSGMLLDPVDRDSRIVIDLTLADLDGDGVVSAVNHRGHQAVESGTIGGLFYKGEENPDRVYSDAMVADADGDGTPEVYTYYARYAPGGSTSWSLESSVYRGPAPVPVQAPTQTSKLLVAWTGMFTDALLITDTSGEVTASVEPGTGRAWVAGGCSADFDGDGAMDVALANGSSSAETPLMTALRGDGSKLWQGEMVDEPGGGGWCSTVDLDGDGSPEVLAVDWDALMVFDGATGNRVFTALRDEQCVTISELPLAIDLDGDGSMELIEPNTFPGSGDPTPMVLRVFRHADAQWPPGAPFWASSSWSGTQLQTNGTIPRRPRKAWETTKLWRGMPTTWIAGGDLQVEVMDACAADAAQLDPPSPDAEVRLAVRVTNLGPEEANTGVQLTVTGTDDDGAALTLASTTWDFLYTGEATATVEVVTTQAIADRGLHLLAEHLVDGALTVQDCDPGNHDWTWTLGDL